MSFSIAVTVPLTTLPSNASFSPPRLLLSNSAKSSRVGNAVVAIKLVVSLTFEFACRRRPPWPDFHQAVLVKPLPPQPHHAEGASSGTAVRAATREKRRV